MNVRTIEVKFAIFVATKLMPILACLAGDGSEQVAGRIIMSNFFEQFTIAGQILMCQMLLCIFCFKFAWSNLLTQSNSISTVE